MPETKYLIVGGGMTADAAAAGIRERDAEGTIGIVSSENDPPYNRPPLSKGLWKGEPLDSVWRKTAATRAELRLGRRIVALDLEARRARDDRGETHGWQKLLLATGGTPRRLEGGDESVIYFRTLADYRRLRQLAEHGTRFAVIGAGFIGSEIAAALAMNGKQVTMLFPERAIGERIFPADLAGYVTEEYRRRGVRILAGDTAMRIAGAGQGEPGAATVTTRHGEQLEADGVIAGLGIRPNLELARAAGLKTNDGIVVDEFLRAGREDVFAAGDVAEFYSPALGHSLRVEHEDNANSMGRAAGGLMAGATEPYRHLPSFYSDLFDLGYEAVGELNAQLETYADWQEPHRQGVVYYLRNSRVCGVLLWNTWGQVENARALIEQGEKITPDALKGRLAA